MRNRDRDSTAERAGERYGEGSCTCRSACARSMPTRPPAQPCPDSDSAITSRGLHVTTKIKEARTLVQKAALAKCQPRAKPGSAPTGKAAGRARPAAGRGCAPRRGHAYTVARAIALVQPTYHGCIFSDAPSPAAGCNALRVPRGGRSLAGSLTASGGQLPSDSAHAPRGAFITSARGRVPAPPRVALGAWGRLGRAARVRRRAQLGEQPGRVGRPAARHRAQVPGADRGLHHRVRVRSAAAC